MKIIVWGKWDWECNPTSAFYFELSNHLIYRTREHMLNFNPVRWTCLVHDTLKTSKYMSRSLDLNLRESLFDQEITSLQFVAILKGLCPSNSFASASLKISFQSALRIRKKKNKSVKFGEGELFYTVDFIETIWGKTCTHVIVLHNCTISLFFSLLWILSISLFYY